MSTSLVSVIIPCYRQAHYLSGAVNSVLDQDFKSVEIVVVNDGSDDNTDEVAGQFSDKIRYVKKTNGGLPSARNAGISVATGKFLFFLDADDLLDPRALGLLVKAVDEREDRLAVMGFRYFQTDPRSDPGEEWTPRAETVRLAQLLEANLAPPHSYLASRKAVNEVGRFNESLKSCEDWDLWVRLGLDGAKLVAVSFIGAFYRRHPGQMTRNQARMERTGTEVLWMTATQLSKDTRSQEVYGPEWPAAVKRLRKRANKELLDAAYNYEIRGEFRTALNAYFLALLRGGYTPHNFLGPLKVLPRSLIYAMKSIVNKSPSSKEK
jgi:glycosyltransferase involved in cell wall biosynthesis